MLPGAFKIKMVIFDSIMIMCGLQIEADVAEEPTPEFRAMNMLTSKSDSNFNQEAIGRLSADLQ